MNKPTFRNETVIRNEAVNRNESKVQEFLRARAGHYDDIDPLSLPVEAGGYDWETVEPCFLNRILGGMLRHAARRAKSVPYYAEQLPWQTINTEDISDIDDLLELPILSKDNVPGTGTPLQPGITGFRNDVVDAPIRLLPGNLEQLLYLQEEANPNHDEILQKYDGQRLLNFISGGSKGKATTTTLTYLTVEMEAHALVRSLFMNGFQQGDSVACFYNSTHKGGLQLARAAQIMAMPFHSKQEIFNTLSRGCYGENIKKAVVDFQAAPPDHPLYENQAALIRQGLRQYIQEHQINVIETVQPPGEFIHNNAKGSSLAFMTMYQEDPSAFSSVNHVFLTGFPVPVEAYETLRANGKQVSTTWGSSEAMALATTASNDPGHPVNDLLATPFPTVGRVVYYQERNGLEQPRLKDVPVNQKGLLLVSSLLGAGTVYVNYLIGDVAVRTSQGYKDIGRISTKNIAGSCAADALAVK